MIDLNKVLLVGNLGADPELRYTAAGTPLLKLRLATSETWNDKAGERQERVEWHGVVLWGPRAEPLARILSKGSSVFVDGGIRTTSYEKDGQKHYKTEVNARDIQVLASKRMHVPGMGAGSFTTDADAEATETPRPPVAARSAGRTTGATAKKPEPMEELPF